MADGSGGDTGSAESVASTAAGPGRRYSRATVISLFAAAVVAVLLVGASIGLALSGRLGSSMAASQSPDSASVDAGFARDMIVHHDQGVLMAHYAERNTSDNEISVMAYDLQYTQTDQIGQMQGWLSLWDLPESGDGTHMGWMADDAGHAGMTMAGPSGASAASALMPGMATTAEVDSLKKLTGPASDRLFLQLMVRHHQGGLPMMQYAAAHATNPVVRNFADKMAQAQESEIAVMTQMLTARGVAPLPAPAG